MAEGMLPVKRLSNTWFSLRARMHPKSAANDAEAYLRAHAENADAPVSPAARARDRVAKALTRRLLTYQSEYLAGQQLPNRTTKPESPGRGTQSMHRFKEHVSTQLSLVALRHQLRYETEQPMVQRLTVWQRYDRTGQLLNPVYGIKSRLASRGALQDDATMEHLEASAIVAPESHRQRRRAQRRVKKALGKSAVLPLASGYKPETLAVDQNAPAQIKELVGGLLSTAPLVSLDYQLDSARQLLFRQRGRPTKIDKMSDVFQGASHAETVRNLLTAKGIEDVGKVVAYRYIRAADIGESSLKNGRLNIFSTPDESSTEDYIVALERTADGEGFVTRDLISLQPTSLEMLAEADEAMRRDPAEPLARNSISALTRVYDLVSADSAMQRVS